MLDKLLKIIPFASLLALWCVWCRSFKKEKVRTHNFTLIISFLSTMFKFSIPEHGLPSFHIRMIGEQGWHSGESTRLPPMWPGFNFGRRRHMWVKFVVGSFLCSERFFSGYSGFPLSSKTNISEFQFDQELGRRRTTMWCATYKSLFTYFLLFQPLAYNSARSAEFYDPILD